jgi:tetratricopeptide (TPR) repeat protein
MDELSARHLWLCGGLRADRANLLGSMDLPPDLMPVVDAHRRLRGPYTAAGTIMRALVPQVLPVNRELARRHDIELLSAAPELSAILPNSRETLTSMALPKERTRFYARLRTVRISHGLVEFLRDGVPADQRWTIVVENIEHAEATDHEFLAAAVRRLDPERVTLVLCSGRQLVPAALSATLDRYTSKLEVGPTGSQEVSPDQDGQDLAWRFVRSDCTSDLSALREAYEALNDQQSADLHDRRAAELAAEPDFSLRLGAIPYHLEHGSDPLGAGAKALHDAEDYCLCSGFYEAVVDYSYRGLALIDPREQDQLWWALTIGLILSLSILGRTHEAMDLCNLARLTSIKPEVHMAVAYSTAMLYTRHNDPAERDEKLAKSWLHAAIATAGLLPDRVECAFQSAFYRNGLALVEVNLGDLNEALRLVDECIDSLDRLLTPDEHRLHRSVLKNNRARVYLGLGRLVDALADYAVVIEHDPNHCEHYLERGNILRRLGQAEAALADYATAIRLSPPFPEIYYNRGDLYLTIGDVDAALSDFSYVLELDPEFVDAYVNRAGIYLEAGELDAAFADAVAGLRLDPDNAHLQVVLGQVYAERGEREAAMLAYTTAAQLSPDLVSALCGRATLSYEQGNLDSALDDLTRAVELSPADAAIRYNRAFLLLEGGRWSEALIDLNIAADLSPEDQAITEARQSCLLHLSVA